MESGFIDKEVGFKEREDDPDIGWIDEKDNGDETWDHDGGGYKSQKEQICLILGGKDLLCGR